MADPTATTVAIGRNLARSVRDIAVESGGNFGGILPFAETQ